MLAAGEDLEGLAALPEADSEPAVTTDHEKLNEVFAVLGDPTLDQETALVRVGRLALAAETGAEGAYVARMERLIGTREWPEGRLLIPAVDVETGEPQVWDGSSGVSLATAVASSSAFPANAPPITINGRRSWTARCGQASTPTSRRTWGRRSSSSRWPTCSQRARRHGQRWSGSSRTPRPRTPSVI
ncbi:hypothetical protein UG56_027330 [Nocardioides luteus]|uniref:Uncharacterized protein n=2 Tax=Nocardioides luteus TaxID=1844 RepID=A0A1J4MVT4_9ACTN|nr:hypothetical protein UG56_027330 [Nocardioides luteus]